MREVKVKMHLQNTISPSTIQLYYEIKRKKNASEAYNKRHLNKVLV